VQRWIVAEPIKRRLGQPREVRFHPVPLSALM
jgi:hypothetical protein